MSDMDDAWKIVQARMKQLAEALNDFKKVEVRSMITELEWTLSEDGKVVTGVQPARDATVPPRGLVSEIDMLTGDISYDSSPHLTELELAKLEKAHDAHLKLGQKIFTENMRFIAETVERFARGRDAGS